MKASDLIGIIAALLVVMLFFMMLENLTRITESKPPIHGAGFNDRYLQVGDVVILSNGETGVVSGIRGSCVVQWTNRFE